MPEKPVDGTSFLTRRAFVVAGGAVAVTAVFRLCDGIPSIEAKNAVPKYVKIVQFSDTGQRDGVVTLPMVVKTDAEWKQQLSPASFEVTRRGRTERAFSGQYWNLHEKGLYRCICCDTVLFNSQTKFKSRTGWPNFRQPIAKQNIRESIDPSLGMTDHSQGILGNEGECYLCSVGEASLLQTNRNPVSCRLCAAHLGDVFDDGPRPTGLRYRMNSVALRFVKLA